MNATQKQIVGWGLAAFVAMILFPPWMEQATGTVRYGNSLLSPPTNYTDAYFIGYSGSGNGPFHVCVERLALQWFALAVACAVLIVLYKETPHTHGVASPTQAPSAQPVDARAAELSDGVTPDAIQRLQ